MKKYLIIMILSVLMFISLLFVGNNFTGYDSAQLSNLTANIVSAIACTFSNDALNVSFGDAITAGSNYNASKNFVDLHTNTWYNITIDITSSSNLNVSIKGTNFISGSNSVGIGNVSWSSNTTSSNGSNMVFPGNANISNSYDVNNLIASDAVSGSVAYYRMWLRLPSGTSGGQYSGTYTLRCTEL